MIHRVERLVNNVKTLVSIPIETFNTFIIVMEQAALKIALATTTTGSPVCIKRLARDYGSAWMKKEDIDVVMGSGCVWVQRNTPTGSEWVPPYHSTLFHDRRMYGTLNPFMSSESITMCSLGKPGRGLYS